MYLRRIELTGFRSCASTVITFQKDVTILAGENNAGKSNVIDALRLFTAPTDGRRTRYAEPRDVTRGTASGFSISGVFAQLTTAQIGLMIGATGGRTEARYQLQYSPPEPGKRFSRPSFTAGVNGSVDVEPEARQRIRHVYLPALRDAQRVLGSGSSDRIAFILRQLAGEKAIEKFVAESQEALRKVEGHRAIEAVNKKVGKALTPLTEGVRPQQAALRFADADIVSLARSLRFRLADRGLDPTDLAESGLGYANLLYMATVVVELQSAKDADLTLFLVEEPEAHLHPQLQSVALEFLRDQAMKSGNNDETQPEGRIQVVATTHSPNLTAAVPVRHIAVLRSVSKTTAVEDAAPDEAASSVSPLPTTAAVLVDELGLNDKILAKIDRYLNVTRSSMLFSRRVLLVEGIAEALLLPVLARECVLAKQSPELARFVGTPIIAIDGVDFEPYVRLLLTATSVGARIADTVVVVTDEDPTTPGDRRKTLESLAKDLGAADCLSVFIAHPTLEPELLANNSARFSEAVLELHTRSEKKWQTEVLDTDDVSAACTKFFKKKRTRKGDFAQVLCQNITDKAGFICPKYLNSAIERVVKLPA